MIRKSYRDVSIIYKRKIFLQIIVVYATYLIELNDVWVSHNLENMDLSGYALDVRLVLDFILLQDFDRYFLARDQVSSQPYLAKSALTKGAS